ncbi:MAG: hypothetical protein ABIQ32_07205 [Sphingomicrobium sp.]
MAFLLMFVAHAALSVGLGFIFGRRSAWSQRQAVMVAALPFPILMWGMGAILLGMISFASATVCEDGCGGPLTAFAVTTVSGFVAYAFGIVFALVGLQFSRPKVRHDLNDVFK